jgi:hypothetical protein
MLINVVLLNCNCFLLFCGQKACCICMQAVNSDYILNGLETVKFVFCLQIYALADLTMNSKFSILHSASPRAVGLLKFIVHCTISACVYL